MDMNLYNERRRVLLRAIQSFNQPPYLRRDNHLTTE
jgi:hypothetical protein